MVKLNCDGAWCSTTGQGGIGVKVRDHTGTMCGGRQNAKVGGSPEEIEAHTIVEAVALAVNIGWPNITVESDSETVIKHIKGEIFIWRIDAILSQT